MRQAISPRRNNRAIHELAHLAGALGKPEVYGCENCLDIAWFAPDLAINNAENYMCQAGHRDK